MNLFKPGKSGFLAKGSKRKKLLRMLLLESHSNTTTTTKPSQAEPHLSLHPLVSCHRQGNCCPLGVKGRVSLVAEVVKNLPAMQETWV